MVKRYFDVLLWADQWSQGNVFDLDQIESLRDYLGNLTARFCGVRLVVPSSHTGTINLLQGLNSDITLVEIIKPAASTSAQVADEELAFATQTALGCNADALVVTKKEWFPYFEDLEKLGVFLTDTGCLKYQCEIFSRGHDVPWSFATQTWNLTWTAFYQLTEPDTFRSGLNLLYAAGKKNADSDGQETGRSLVHNRLPNICFTRNRLLFCEIQRLVALRSHWTRQSFSFETAYYLNFYYPLIYGGFDQLALVTNYILKLGIPEKNVGATYAGFLANLKVKSGALHTIFADTTHVEFIQRIGALRHFASHRGSLMPTKLLERPDREPTNEELDAAIVEAGMDEIISFMPEGELRESFREATRYQFRVALYEKSGNVIEGVVPIVIDGKSGFIRPAMDTHWNFQRFLLFMDKVFVELANNL